MNKFLGFSSRTGNKFIVAVDAIASINYIKDEDKIIIFYKDGCHTELNLGIDFENKDLVQLRELLISDECEDVEDEENTKQETDQTSSAISQEDLSEVTALLGTLTSSLGDVVKNLGKSSK